MRRKKIGLIMPTRRLLCAGIAVVVVSSSGAHAAEPEPAQRRREVKRRQAEIAAQVDVLRASDNEVERALDQLEADVAAQRAATDAARQAAQSAQRAAAEARRAEQSKAAEVERLRAQVKAMAVEAYVSPVVGDLGAAIRARDLDDAVRKRYYLELRQERGAALIDAAAAAREDLAVRRAEADAVERSARERETRAEASLASLRGSLGRQQRFATELETRLDRVLGEVASLAALDRQLAEEVARRNEALAARTRRVGAPSGVQRASRSTVSRSGSRSLTTVRGITVDSSIADDLERLLVAAEADGFAFSGGGYRDPEAQIAARRANCGTSDYAVYDMPPSQCSPPTARPGTSMHEQGLAVDFTWNGRIISSRSSPAFGWLRQNAAQFGFYNLPAEPWHWSVNGN